MAQELVMVEQKEMDVITKLCFVVAVAGCALGLRKTWIPKSFIDSRHALCFDSRSKIMKAADLFDQLLCARYFLFALEGVICLFLTTI